MDDLRLDRIRELAAEIRRAIGELRSLGRVTQAEFLEDTKALNSAKYLLIVCCEAAIDICNHLAARRGGRAPADYADCFEVLREMRALDLDLSSRLARMAKLRNLLVHLYWKVDNTRVYQAIRDDLGDYEAYLAAIGRYLATEI